MRSRSHFVWRVEVPGARRHFYQPPGSGGNTSSGGSPRKGKRSKLEIAEKKASDAEDTFFNAQNDVVRVQKELENANKHYWTTFWRKKQFCGGNLVEAAMSIDEMEKNLIAAEEVLASVRVAAIDAAKVCSNIRAGGKRNGA